MYRAPVSATGPQRGPASSRTERALQAPSVRLPGAARPNAPAGPCGAAVRALAPPVKKARPSPPGAARPCLFSGAAAPISSPRRCSGAQSGPVGWWPCCAPSAPPFARFAHRAKGGRSRPVPLRCATACVEPGAGATGGVADSCRRWGLRARQFERRPRGCSAPRGKGRRSYGAFAGGEGLGSLSPSLPKKTNLGAMGPQPPTTPTGQPPLCAWPSPLCSPARRQGSSRAAKGLPLTPAAVCRKAPLARRSNHTQRGLSHVHTSQQSARPAPDGAGAGRHSPAARPRAGTPGAAAPLSAGAHRAGVLRRFPAPPTFRRVS